MTRSILIPPLHDVSSQVPANPEAQAPAAMVVKAPAATVVQAPAATVVQAPAATVVKALAATVVQAPAATESNAPAATVLPAPAAMVLYVCTTCRDADHVVGQDTPCAGARLFSAIGAEPADPAITIVPVECLSVCKRVCAVSFAAPGKWTTVYGDLPAATAAATILRGARLYAEAPDGLIPWKLRPDALKKGAVARIPPWPPRTPESAEQELAEQELADQKLAKPDAPA